MNRSILFLFCLFELLAAPISPGYGQDSTTTEMEPQILTRFGLDWQTCTIHRYNTAGPFAIVLSGSIHSTAAHCWMLWSLDKGNQLSCFSLHHKLLKKASIPEEAIRVHWQFSLDGGPFTDLTIESDGRIRIHFPPDYHTFQLRISGTIPDVKQSGHYTLHFQQGLVPTL